MAAISDNRHQRRTVGDRLRDAAIRCRPTIPSRFKRNTWRPARITYFDFRIIVVCLIFQAYARGFDYLLEGTGGWRYFTLRQEWIADAWAGTFIVGALLLTIGAAFRVHTAVYLGHAWLAVVYSCLAVWLWTVNMQDGDIIGVRAASSLTIVWALHITLAIRTGPRPLPTTITDGRAV